MQSFDFGANWTQFSEQVLEPKRVSDAITSLQSLLGQPRLENLSFLDVGCGSGLFSIAAARLGAGPVVGIDLNPRCVEISEQNRVRFAPDADIRFVQASALSPAALETLGHFDLVYAWGSLHHTGAMWQAIGNVAKRVSPGGSLVLAIYNKHVTSPAWKGIKWLYNQVPGIVQRVMAGGAAGVIYVAKFLVIRRNPLDKERGMDFWHDVVDWVGGYPYEYAAPGELTDYVTGRGFSLVQCVRAQVPTGCNEFVFRRTVMVTDVCAKVGGARDGASAPK